MLSLLSLRRCKEVWVFKKDYNDSRSSSARTAKLVELFFTPSLLLHVISGYILKQIYTIRYELPYDLLLITIKQYTINDF